MLHYRVQRRLRAEISGPGMRVTAFRRFDIIDIVIGCDPIR